MMPNPTSYTAEMAERILDQLQRGRTLREVCADEAMPSAGTVRQWVRQDRCGFAARYRRARQLRRAAFGRPTRCTAEMAERILRELSIGRTLTEVCGDPAMPASSTVRQWAMQDRAGFAARYRQARQAGRAGTGRPSLYTADMAEDILDQLSEGRTLTDICGEPDMPVHVTVRLWAKRDRDGFAARYHAARQFGCDVMADQIVDIADDSRGDWTVIRKPNGRLKVVFNPSNLRRSRQRIKERQWLLSKLRPRTYGPARKSSRAPSR